MGIRKALCHSLRSVETIVVDIRTGALRITRDEPGGCPFIGQVVSGMKAA
ncbi:hypothetical protein LX86_006403, partial [Lentzea aerocolonigenes]|nr:hypothetical protein [Lentzea aerocolonigenes]